MSETAIQFLEHIEAQLNYLSDTSEKPVAYAYEPPPGVPWATGQYKARQATIHDLRPLAQEFSLDEAGFQLVSHRSAVPAAWRLETSFRRNSSTATAGARPVWSDPRKPYAGRSARSYNVTYSAGHSWFYAPQMRSDEALLIKCFDSRDDGRAARDFLAAGHRSRCAPESKQPRRRPSLPRSIVGTPPLRRNHWLVEDERCRLPLHATAR
jgi:hypothetical protein